MDPRQDRLSRRNETNMSPRAITKTINGVRVCYTTEESLQAPKSIADRIFPDWTNQAVAEDITCGHHPTAGVIDNAPEWATVVLVDE